MHTNGYYSAYLAENRAPGGEGFAPTGIDVKSRDSDARFMVLQPFGWFPTIKCTRDQLVQYAKSWGGYEVTGQEREYYMGCIKAAREEKAKRPVKVAPRSRRDSDDFPF